MSTVVNILVTYENSFTDIPDKKSYNLTYTLADAGLRGFVIAKTKQGHIANIADEPNGVFESFSSMVNYYFIDAAEELMTDLNGAQSVDPFTYGILVFVDESVSGAIGSKQNKSDSLDQLSEIEHISSQGINLLGMSTPEDIKTLLDIQIDDVYHAESRFNSLETDVEYLKSLDQFSPVVTVNTRAGNVVLTATDVGLENVTNVNTATTANITDSSNKRFVTDARLAILNALAGTNLGDQDLSGLVTKTTTVNGHALSANVTVTKSDVGLANCDNTSDVNKSVSTATQTAINAKVDKITGKGLSAEDYTTIEKTKLSGITAAATANDTDANLKNRTNHTGTQAASTIIGLSAVATTGSYADLFNKPNLIKTYFGSTLRDDSIMYTGNATVSSGIAVFNLTTDGTSGGTAIFPNGPNMDSINAFVSDATASYQMSYVLTNANKTLTITANKLTTANILTGILGQAQANASVVRLTIWGR